MANPNLDFASMLDDLIAAEGSARGAAARIAAVDFLAALDEKRAKGFVVDDGQAAVSYGEASVGEPDAEPPPAPRLLPSLDPDDIRRELGLDKGAAGTTLSGLRRRFAFENHPDRVTPELRDRAEQRMRIANMLVDAARKRATAR